MSNCEYAIAAKIKITTKNLLDKLYKINGCNYNTYLLKIYNIIIKYIDIFIIKLQKSRNITITSILISQLWKQTKKFFKSP